MYTPRINFKNEILFHLRFKRNPKQWSLVQLQDLWERLSERGKKRKEMLYKVYDKIINEIPENENGRKLVYYTENDIVYNYEFSYFRDTKSWGYSSNRVDFSKEKVIGRDEKIEFILSNSRAFELGQEYRDVLKLRTKFEYMVKGIFVDMVESRLKSVYKDSFPPDITVVKVGDRRYYFEVDSQHRYSYLKFHFKGLVSDEIIVL